MIRDVAATPRLLEQQPALRVLWKAALVPIVGICYLGVAIAVPITEFLAFNVLKWFGLRPPNAVYWALGLAVTAGMLVVCYLAGIAVYRRIRARCIDIDLILIFVGAAVGVYLAVWVLPTGL